MSLWSPAATLAMTLPSPGSWVSKVSPSNDSVHLPSMNRLSGCERNLLTSGRIWFIRLRRLGVHACGCSERVSGADARVFRWVACMGASLVRAATMSCSKTGQSATPVAGRDGHRELDSVGGGGRACWDGAKAVANIVEPEEVIKYLTVRHL